MCEISHRLNHAHHISNNTSPKIGDLMFTNLHLNALSAHTAIVCIGLVYLQQTLMHVWHSYIFKICDIFVALGILHIFHKATIKDGTKQHIQIYIHCPWQFCLGTVPLDVCYIFILYPYAFFGGHSLNDWHFTAKYTTYDDYIYF